MRELVLYYASWCPFSRAFLEKWEKIRFDLPFPTREVDLGASSDEEWERVQVEVVPTLVLRDGSREIDRLEALLGVGIRERDLEAFLQRLESPSER